jgi:hypothetical protein
MSLTPQEHYGRMVCLFLAEGLRTRHISVKRAADIAEKVLAHFNLLDSETAFMSFVKELSLEFQELGKLQSKIVKDSHHANRRGWEKAVQEYATGILHSDSRHALDILESASHPDAKLEDILKKFPRFKQFYHSYERR